jgi:hypothetical protein
MSSDGRFADVEIHPLDVQRGAHAVAHHRDQLFDVVERGQLLREVGHRPAMAIALAVQDHLDDRFDLAFHRNQHAGDEQAGAEREEVALHRRALFDETREHEVHGRERDHAERERDRVRQHLFDHDLDVPQLVLEDRDRERERDERQRQNRDRRVDRLRRRR